jgi:hypothetical protein
MPQYTHTQHNNKNLLKTVNKIVNFSGRQTVTHCSKQPSRGEIVCEHDPWLDTQHFDTKFSSSPGY